ncbi:hypothetical protein [Rossellomorea arthrocnemi]|uniref:hypothetical protein n=1 Tax=Rossellomorea arthrocnemi TaxID=2769542 RepID=UPI001E374599|nr:hypothetical protein [Rossellomorea arthrocnemi]
MKKYLTIGSFLFFLISLIIYILSFLGYDTFLLPAVIISVIGFITALFGEKSIYRKIGLFGNGVILVVVLLIPFIVTTFFWNSP